MVARQGIKVDPMSVEFSPRVLREILTASPKRAGGLLWIAFKWMTTPEGTIYWGNIARDMETEGKPLPEEARNILQGMLTLHELTK